MISATVIGIKNYLESVKRKFLFDDDLLTTFIKIMGINITLFIISIFFTKILSFIPIINNNPIYNYGLNILINVVVLALMAYILRDKKNA